MNHNRGFKAGILGEVVPRKGEIIGYDDRLFRVEDVVHRLEKFEPARGGAEGIDIIIGEIKH